MDMSSFNPCSPFNANFHCKKMSSLISLKAILLLNYKEMWYIYTVEYYSAIKKSEIMPFAATQMDLDIIILSEVSQTKRNII